MTTHWRHTEELQVRFPQAKVVDNQLFVADGTIWSSGGMTVCVDVALEMVERDLGREIALSVTMVMQQRRAGGQPQRSVLLELGARTDRVQDALAYARRNLRKSFHGPR